MPVQNSVNLFGTGGDKILEHRKSPRVTIAKSPKKERSKNEKQFI